MRIVLVLVVTWVTAVSCWKLEYTTTGREEGEECRRQADEVWTCKKSNECEALRDLLSKKSKIETCAWQSKTPIICCPPNKETERISTSKSEEKCTEYSQLLCGETDGFVLASVAQPTALLQREKRQDFTTPDAETTPQVWVSSAVGGRPTAPQEFPSVHPKKNLRAKKDLSHTDPDPLDYKPPVLAVAGGLLTKPGEMPIMALIGYGDPGAINWQCGGSLISETFVLSAAHCVNTPYGLARWVRVGDLDLSSDSDDARPQEVEIVERVVHPGYRAPAFYNDIALFRLARPVVFDRYVRPACLHGDTKDPGGRGTAAGWGKNETNGPRSSALLQVDISFVPGEECKRLVGTVNKYLPNGIDTDGMICAGEPGKDTCQGDSGGPLILPASPFSDSDCLARLVGVTSFGPRNCGMTSVPGAYVRVAHFLSWIESIVWPE